MCHSRHSLTSDYDNIMPEDTNTNVDKINNQVNGSELSTDKAVDIDSMNEEQLRDFAKREREAKERAVAHMIEQSKKRKSIEETVLGQSQVKPDESQTTQTIEELRAEAKRLVQEEHREARIAEYSEGSTDWFKSQPWANEINTSDTLYGEFSQEVKRLAEKKGVRSQEDFRKLMRIATVTVTGKSDALLKESADAEVASDKQQSTGYRPSHNTNPAQSYAQFSPMEQQMLREANELRAKVGKPPIKVVGGKIIKD